MRSAVDTVAGTVGQTPVLRLARVCPADAAEVWLKLESFSPTGSAKDRLALAALDRLSRAGAAGRPLVLATSGNFGIAVAVLGAKRGAALTVVMPESMTQERRALLRAAGATVVLTPAAGGLAAAEAKAEALALQMGATCLHQREEGLAEAAYGALAEELVGTARAVGTLDGFVVGWGTGGLWRATQGRVRRAFPAATCTVVQPEGQRLQGLEEAVAPAGVAVTTVDDASAWRMTRRLGREEGLLVGISTGANVVASIALAQRLGPGRRVFALSVDTGERYFSLAAQFR